ncbi:MAG TPA: TIM-barrel domain-containing protein [Opitutaceae bacterium]|nr:TIM-barrel domain-containing protein [Opitutaceae bacterium]
MHALAGRPIALAAAATLALIPFAPPPAAAAVEKLPDGIVVPVGDTFLKIEVRADNIVRIAAARDRKFFDHASLAVLPAGGPAPRWELTTAAGTATLSTAQLKVQVELGSGAVAFLDAAGRPVLAEQPLGREITVATVQGEQTNHVRQTWEPNADESLYGLGENQLGLMDLKGYDLDLWQHNGTAAIPFLVSSRGYGIFWDNPSYTRFGDLRLFEPIPAALLLDADGKPGGLTGTYYADADFGRPVARQLDPRVDVKPSGPRPVPNTAIQPALPPAGEVSVRWEGSVVPEVSGDYQFQIHSNGGIRLWVDGHLVADHWRQEWLPWYDLARVHLEAGRRHALRLDWTRTGSPPVVQLRWKTPAASAATALWSEVGGGTDYYFVYGPELDRVVAGYRQLTGAAPMMPRWAFGLWQSRQRYRTAEELLGVVKGFRDRGIPFDNIVQDWFYWRRDAWGSHEFDPARFPDPAGMIRAIHDQYHARLMISVWPKFYPGTKNFEAMQARGFLFQRNLQEQNHDWVGFRSTYYDAFNPEARKLYWAQIERELFRKGVDAWWLDATEPELAPNPTVDVQRSYMNPTALGPGSRVLNAFPLMNSGAVYNGQRAAAPDQRVFILTRSGYAGQQRFAAAVWSGDTSSTWTAMRKQIPAGLGFCLSGLPYWTMDVGGFSVPQRYAPNLGNDANGDPIYGKATEADTEDWCELNTRWFEFGTFVPLLRPHGEFPYREMWQFGGESSPAYQAQLKFDRLRYRLLPYIYSLAGMVTHEGGTILRPLVMDFREDATAREISDEYMFGPALLVSPVTVYQARSRPVYLPASAGWYDFWNGAAVTGGQTIEAPAPYDAIPVHVRAGAILPFGPDLQYTEEKPADPITLFVYAGADGAFTLYEDDGLTYGYEKGACARIPLRWDDAAGKLTIGRRDGAFPGMLAKRTFQVVLVAKGQPAGFPFTSTGGRTVTYAGDAVTVSLR